MRIKTVSYKRTKQVAKYEPEVIEITIDLEYGETVKEVIAKARKLVAEEFGEESDPCSCSQNTLFNKGCSCGGN
jgi:uncharacterized alkaline shock family protein YloU